MKLKIILFTACLSLLSLLPLSAKKVAVFDEFGQPEGMVIGNGYIYINEKTTIYIYNLADYKFVKKFGQEGEGPGEIKLNPFGGPLVVLPDKGKIYITSAGKLTIFSKTGEYIKEYKVNAFDSYYPFAEKYICYSSTPKEKDSREIVLALFMADKNFKKGKLIYKSDFEVGMNVQFNFPITPFYPGIADDKLFVTAGIHGFAIDVFDKNGDKLYRIKKDYKQLKIPSYYKDRTLKWFKKDPGYRQFYEFFKDRISFKDYYPPIYTMLIDKGKIYILTNKMKQEQRECIIMDLKGNEIKRVYLPVQERYGMDYSFHFIIFDNYFYKLEENIDDETWELSRISIDALKHE